MNTRRMPGSFHQDETAPSTICSGMTKMSAICETSPLFAFKTVVIQIYLTLSHYKTLEGAQRDIVTDTFA